MEGREVPPFRLDPFGTFWLDSNIDVVLPDMAPLHALSETMGAKTVRRLLKYEALPIEEAHLMQYNQSPVHGPHIRLRFIPVLPVLPARGLLRSHQGLLRSLRNRQLFLAFVPLHSA